MNVPTSNTTLPIIARRKNTRLRARLYIQVVRFFPIHSSSFPWQPDAFVDITIIIYATIIITHVWDVPKYYMCIAL